jgi:hypothetical protein
MKADTEDYLSKFHKFITEAKEEREKEELNNKNKIAKKVINKEIETDEEYPDGRPDNLISDTLSPKEKKKKASKERSDQRKRSWGASHTVSTEPDGYKELKSLSKGIAETKGKDKPDCRPGGKWHDKKGKFSSKSDATSWSGGYEDSNRTDCKAGKFKTTGDGRKKITKHKCGKASDGSKEKFKCKDGQPYWKLDEEIEARPNEIELSLEQVVGALKKLLAEDPGSRSQVEAELKTIGFYGGNTFREKAKAAGFYNLEQWTKIQNSQALAQKGELYKKKDN